MAFWSGQTLAQRAESEKLIVPFERSRIDCSAYALSVGFEAFVSRDRADQAVELSRGRTPGHLLASREETFAIPSGQFAFLIANEKVKIPGNAIGFISLKSSRKWGGLVNVSGFHVDPGWSGRLLFSVFNAGPNTVIIPPGEALFLLFFSDLDQEADTPFIYSGDSRFDRIPPRFMELMSAPVPSVYNLNQAVKDLRETAMSAQSRSNMALTLAATLGGAALAASIAVFIRIFIGV